MKHGTEIVCATLVATTVACVAPQQVELIEREQQRLRGQNTTVLADLGGMRSDIETIRVSLADTRANVQQLQRELGALKESIDEARYQMGQKIGQSSREGDQRVKDLEARVSELSETIRAQEAAARSREDEVRELREVLQASRKAALESPAEQMSDALTGESDSIRRDYGSAWRVMEIKDFPAAIARFTEFLKKHPKSSLAANAQYWIGECYYALRKFDQAIIEFDVVRRKYPEADKVPAALLKQGFAFAELGEKLNARLVLQEVVEKFPESAEAGKAKLRLKALES